MADHTLQGELSRTVNVGTGGEVLIFASPGQGSIKNNGTNAVYLEWNGAAATATSEEGVNNMWLDSDESVKVPQRATKVAMKTATGTSFVHWVDD